jgi:hypothetical protein
MKEYKILYVADNSDNPQAYYPSHA